MNPVWRHRVRTAVVKLTFAGDYFRVKLLPDRHRGTHPAELRLKVESYF